MISQRALDAALARGILGADQAAGLRAIEAEVAGALPPEATPEPADDEALRFVTGFADIFVTIGLALFLGALAAIMDVRTGSTPMFAGLAVSSWLLAEFFTGRRRMALPSIVLLVVFVGATFVLSLQVFTSLLPPGPAPSARFWFVPTTAPAPLAVAAILATAMAAMHYVRFRVPITIAAGAGSLCVLALATAASLDPDLGALTLDLVLLACGVGVFALAMRFDVSDPERLTRRTDIAFWLHLLAAPLIVHTLLNGVLHGLGDRLTTGAAVGILWVFLLLGAVALVIDRRALLVSGLVYAGVAFGSLARTLGFASPGLLLPCVLLALGAFVLLVSAGWQPLRRAILRRLPLPIARRLPHPLVSSST